MERFRDVPGDSYNVPTLIARDGVHPSNPLEFQSYSEQSLSSNGFALRNALTLAPYAEVIRTVLRPSRSGESKYESQTSLCRSFRPCCTRSPRPGDRARWCGK